MLLAVTTRRLVNFLRELSLEVPPLSRRSFGERIEDLDVLQLLGPPLYCAPFLLDLTGFPAGISVVASVRQKVACACIPVICTIKII